MDVFNFLKSVNKVAIAAFFLTGSILLYEIYLFLKQAGAKKPPKIPELQKVSLSGLQKTTTVVKKRESKNTMFKPSNPIIIIILVVLVLILGGAFWITGLGKKVPFVNQPPSPTPRPYLELVKSEGIKIYNESWQELTKNQLRYFHGGDKIIIAVKNIAGTDIIKVRIRVNTKTWTPEHETNRLNQKLGVFYQTYQITSADATLKIEAQLYSQKDGWLGE